MKNKTLPISVLTSNQTQTFTKSFDGCRLDVSIRFDDRCKNKHNSFSITSDFYKGLRLESCGCQHDLVSKHFPELRKYIKWHLTSTDGPLHYIANTMYFVKLGQFENARNCAVMPNAHDSFFTQDTKALKEALTLRLPALMEEFKTDMIELGFTY